MIVNKFYDFEEIKQASDCIAVAKELGLEVKDNRCKAQWRNGDNETSISLSKTGFHDFTNGQSGGAINLVALMMFDDDIQQAQQYLGEKLLLNPKMTLEQTRKSRVQILKEKGYNLTKEYLYQDENAVTKHIVQRWEHADKENKKQFVQKTAEGRYSIKGIKTVLYNLPQWIKSDNVCICEGEKDAETLKEIGFNATCNASGASRWEDYYNDWIKGKDVVIVVDNDDAGEKRLNFLSWELKDIAKSIKVITFHNKKKGYDISDYLNENGTESTRQLILGADTLKKENIKQPDSDYHSLMIAKDINKKDFLNYKSFVNDKEEHVKEPLPLHSLTADCNSRFLGFPCRVGERLFDKNKESNEIEFINDSDSFFSWIMQKSKKLVRWKNGEGFITKKEFFAGIQQNAKRYESISHIPDYPRRSDVFYNHPPMPRASENHKYFNRLIEFFAPATNADKILMKAFFTAPLFYIKGIQSPSWIIDSNDGAGTGKTTLVELVAELYKTEPVRTSKEEMKHSSEEIKKRLISASGRMKKILLIDNVQGEFRCPELADMISAKSLSGRPSYGKGEETRENNLNYVITANSATVDNDIVIRSFYIFVKKIKYNPLWKTEINGYISENRYKIIADMIDILENSEQKTDPFTRFPEFETKILQAYCKDLDELNEVKEAVLKAKTESNIDEENAIMIQEKIKTEITNLCLDPNDCFFIRSEVLKVWFADSFREFGINNVQYVIKDYSKQGMIKEIDKKIRMYPHNTTKTGIKRRRGIMWNGHLHTKKVLGLQIDKKVGVIFS